MSSKVKWNQDDKMNTAALDNVGVSDMLTHETLIL